MWRYIVKRLLWMVLTTLCVALIIFTIMYFFPGDPAELILGSTATAEELEAYREYLGLNEPYIVQLATYMSDTFLHLDLGTAWVTKVDILEELGRRVPRTLALGWTCIILNSIIGIPLGVTCALKRNSIWDRGVMVFAMLGVSMPDFWVALMLVIIFSQKLGWLPSYGIGSLKHWIMPVIAGSIQGIATNARQTRSAVLETIRADFVTTARAKGLTENTVVYKHMLPNAIIPVVGQLGAAFGRAIGGTVVIETVFSFPGVGSFMTTAVTSHDIPVVRSCVLVLAIFSTVANLLVDICYAYLDPRIKAQYVSFGKGKG